MFAMQYGFDFPDDFDMGAVRRRVAEIGPRFDALPDLGYKAFLVADRDAHGPGRYTPFYVWRDLAGLHAFLRSPAFQAVVDKYGRPAVDSWHPVAAAEPAQRPAEAPRFALREETAIAPGLAVDALFQAEREDLAARSRQPGLQRGFTGFDPHGWRLLRLSLWTQRPSAALAGRVFEVAYLAQPAA